MTNFITKSTGLYDSLVECSVCGYSCIESVDSTEEENIARKSHICIEDIIHHKGQYSTQIFVVVDKMPELLYTRNGSYLIGEESGFYNFYGLSPASKGFSAFGGREFDIPLKDGGVEKARGQWWNSTPEEYMTEEYVSVGVSTKELLNNCYVFSSMIISKDRLDSWLEKHEPSNNYYKYDKR